MQLNSIVMGLAGADRVFKLLDEEPEKDDGYVTLVRAKAGADGVHHRMPGAHRHLGLEALPQGRRHHGLRGAPGRHRHGRRGLRLHRDKLVLHDIKLYAEPGQKIAFVGSTGAGKTTITNLINRFTTSRTARYATTA
jgi:ATP-binding cassette subfamily B protein